MCNIKKRVILLLCMSQFTQRKVRAVPGQVRNRASYVMMVMAVVMQELTILLLHLA